MGVCSSCLGQRRHDSNDSESSRLLEDDIYQASYGYGALNQASQLNQSDTEYFKREREALDAICQRTSDSVIDIWSVQPQPHLQPRATLQTFARQGHRDQHSPLIVTTGVPVREISPADRPGGAVPEHWGAVVVNPRRGKPSQPGLNAEEVNKGGDVFGVLNVA